MKLYIETHGCQMNEYDSNRMADLLKSSHGMVRTSNAEEADVLLINTCSIREKAEDKVFSELGRWRKLKAKKPGALIGVGGCVASQEGAAIRERAPFVDLVFGPQTLHRLPELIQKRQETGQMQSTAMDISFPEIEKFDRLPKPQAHGPSAYVSIMEGCNKYCSYCIVPYTRGPEVNRPLEDILEEILGLSAQGVKEIVLLGQNVNAYKGRLPGHSGHSGDSSVFADLALLIAYVAELPEIGRIRFTTSHPGEFNDNLIEAYRNIPKLVNHLHLPVQSGSNRILSLMKRNHSRETYIEKIQKLRAIRPEISISSDFIVGFPGETENDFEDTLDLVRVLNLDQSYSFIYSKRPGTPAADLPDELTLEIKKERLGRLQALLNQQFQSISEATLGSLQTILITGTNKKDPSQIQGRTENNRIVYLKGDSSLIGNFVEVQIQAVLTNSLRGQLL
ncbi:MAG: tRNA (N6-isopentenyl adenosine(37)-C2)-methylthiotransferase MiaB [Gammaproteobacteria bacterium]